MLTGFKFNMLTDAGSMLIKSTVQDDSLPRNLKFGVNSHQWPRFTVSDEAANEWGIWDDTGATAFAGREVAGYHSVYCGTAPLPIPLVRWLAQKANVRLWSDKSDIIRATEDAAMIVATSGGHRKLTLQKPMAPVEGGNMNKRHDLNLEKGEVRIFTV
jgi:hypothetical protein